MILDIEHLNRGNLRLSYFDKDGAVKVKDFLVPDPSNWEVCSDRDRKKSTIMKNWDGQAVKKVPTRYLNKHSVAEFIESLPKEDHEEITALNFPKVQSIDIETEVIDGFPNPDVARERITTIAIAFEDCKTMVMGWKPLSKEAERSIYDQHREYLKEFGDWEFRYVNFKNEYEMLYALIHKILPKCSVVIGWNMDFFDWPYITNRCNRLAIDISMASPSRRTHPVRTKEGAELKVPYHIGIIDYLTIYKKWDRVVKVKESNSLDFVSNAVLGTTKIKYDGTLQQLYEEDYDKYVLYNAIDAALVTLIHKKLRTINAAFSVASYCNLSIYKASSPVALTEALMWRGFFERGMVIADRRLDKPKGEYEGAYVKRPVPGMYRGVACYDFASLYPSIMRQFNISPESYIKKELDPAKIAAERERGEFIVAETGTMYKREESVTKELLARLYAERREHKDRYIEIEKFLSRRKKKTKI